MRAVTVGAPSERRERERSVGVELRSIVSKVQLRVTDGEPTRIVGYAAVYNVETVIGCWFREVIVPGAFDGVLDGDTAALLNHDENLVLGRTTSGTLRLSSDATGLGYEIDPPDTSYARDLIEVMKRGDISGSSFGFMVDVDGDEWDYSECKDGMLPLRKITKVSELRDVSPVTFPAYDETTVAARDAAAALVDARAIPDGTLERERSRERLRVAEKEC